MEGLLAAVVTHVLDAASLSSMSSSSCYQRSPGAMSPFRDHRSHFGSRYKSGCCGHAGLFCAGSIPAARICVRQPRDPESRQVSYRTSFVIPRPRLLFSALRLLVAPSRLLFSQRPPFLVFEAPACLLPAPLYYLPSPVFLFGWLGSLQKAAKACE